MSADQRTTFRVVTHQDGQLRLGKQVYPCAIENESAGGFCARIPQPLHFDRGLQLELETDGGVTIVRVARCKIGAEGTMIGLERVRDLAAKRELDNASWSIYSYCSGWRRKAEGMTLGTMAAVCILGVLGVWGLVKLGYAMVPAPSRGVETNTAFGNLSATYIVASRRSLSEDYGNYLDQFRSTRIGQANARNQAVQENYARSVRQRLLASNQAAIALGLSNEQIETIRAALQSAESEINSISSALHSGDDVTGDANSRLEEAEQASLACLSQEQRLLWATLTGLKLPQGERQE